MRMIDADALIEFCAERWIPLNIDAVNMQPTIQPEKAQLSKEGTTSDMISREAVIDLLKQMRKDGDMVPWEGKNVFARIRKLPSAQPEVRTGKWTLGFDNRYMEKYYYCSRCGGRKYGEHEPLDYFCSNCGAKMKGGSNERTD